MQIIETSVRKDFESTLRLAPMRFRVQESQAELSREEVIRRCAGRTVCILVHGYRVKYAGALSAYHEVIEMAKAAGIEYDVWLPFYWPGSSLYFGFLAATGRANQAGDHLGKLIAELRYANATVDVETHSLGARVACEALDEPGANVRLAILTAPAIPDHLFEPIQEFAAVPYATQAMHLCCSRTDEALVSFRATSWFHGALGLKGPRDMRRVPSTVHFHDFTADCADHSDYKHCVELYAKWRKWAS